MRVLLVEDSRTDALLVERMLRQEYADAVSIDCVENLEDAGRLIARAMHDVVVLDLNLPDSAGLETFERVHALLSGTPTVLLTGTDDDRLALEAMRTGAQDYLLKSEVNGRMLRRSISHAVERQRLVRQLQERVRETTCLHGLAHLLQDSDQEPRALAAQIVNLLPAAFQYPELLCARLVIADTAVVSREDCPPTPWMIEESFETEGICRAVVQVWYTRELPVQGDSPFLPEEAALLRTVKEMIRAHCGRRMALQQLRRQEALLAGVLDAMPVAVWLLDADGNTISRNAESTRLAGGRQLNNTEQLAGLCARWTQTGVPLKPEEWPPVRAVFHGESPVNRLIDIDGSDGNTTTILGSAAPFCSEGTFQCAIAVCQDVTELKKAQDEVHQAAEQRLAILNALPANIVLLDGNGVIAAVNAGWERFVVANGYEEAGHGIGKVYLDIYQAVSGFSSEEGSFVSAGVRSVIEGKMPYFTLEYPLKRLQSLRWYRVTAHPLSTGQMQGAVVMYMDITARKLAEEDLRHQKELLQKIFDNIPVMLVMLDAAGKVQWVNRAWESTLGHALEEVRGKDMYAVIDHRPLLRPDTEEELLFPPKDGWSDMLITTKDGRTLSTSWGTILLSDGTTIGIGQDLSQRRLLEEQLMQAQKMEGIGRLAGGVAHDFNNLLSAILGYAEFALTALDPENPVHADVEQIQKAGIRATELTRQLLAFARRQIVEVRIVDVSGLVMGLNRLLRRLIGEDIELVILPEQEAAKVRADPGQLEQVLVNLAVNARDAMPEGGKLTIEIRNVELGEEYERQYGRTRRGKYVELRVSDTGHGMGPEVISHAFEPFFTTKEVGKGTGLGLATCYGIVKQADGDIWISSTPHAGATVTIYLPAAPDAQPAAESIVAERSVKGGTETILVVEDEPLVREMVVKALTKLGYRVLVAENGPEALRIAVSSSEGIDLLITDVVMPHMGGKEVAERMMARHPATRVLFMSGYTEDTVLRQGFESAERHFLAKPFTARALARKVRELLDLPPPPVDGV